MVEVWEMITIESELLYGVCGFILAFYFLNKLLRVRKTTRELLPFIGLTIGFLSWGISYFTASWREFFNNEFNLNLTNPELFQLLLKIEWAVLWITLLIVIILTEYSIKKTRYLVTSYMLVVIPIMIFFEHQIFITAQLIFTPPILLALLILIYFAFIKPTPSSQRRRVYFIELGFMLVAVGVAFRTRLLEPVIGEPHTLIANILGILGMIFVGYGFAAFSTFTDLKWKEKLRELFVISPKGICIYAYSFEQKIALVDSDLIAGGFTGIQMLLSEMVKTNESLHLIDYQNVKIMVEQKAEVMFVLIITEASGFLPYKLKLFAEEFITFFKDVLEHWVGQMDVFEPTKALIQKNFEVGTKL